VSCTGGTADEEADEDEDGKKAEDADADADEGEDKLVSAEREAVNGSSASTRSVEARPACSATGASAVGATNCANKPSSVDRKGEKDSSNAASSFW
jgi:hypothetical protein